MRQLELDHYPKYLDHFRAFIDHTSPISDSSWDKLRSLMKLWRAEKGQRLLDYMEVETTLRFIGRGIVKCEDHFNGQSFVYDFRVGPIILSETFSLIHAMPSRITMETCTECDFIALPREPLLKLIASEPDLAKFSTYAIVNYMAMGHYRQSLLRTLDAESRYKLFLSEFPQVAVACKLEDIASYLKVTPPSLSRIRRNIHWSEKSKPLEVFSNELDLVHQKWMLSVKQAIKV